MFANFLHINEFIWSQLNKTSDFKQWYLIRSLIIFQNDFLQLILSSFKINFFRCKIALIIIIINDEVYVKNLFVNLFTKFSASLLMFLFGSKYSYMWTYIIKILRRMLVILSIKDCYSNHFSCQDVTISAHQAKLWKNEIQLLKRWKFNNYCLYIEAHSSYILNVFKKH